jgi:hypothetical protein
VETGPAACGNVRRRPVRAEKSPLVELIEGDETRHSFRHPHMPGERSMLGTGELQAPFGFDKADCGTRRTEPEKTEGKKLRIHATYLNPRNNTNS